VDDYTFLADGPYVDILASYATGETAVDNKRFSAGSTPLSATHSAYSLASWIITLFPDASVVGDSVMTVSIFGCPIRIERAFGTCASTSFTFNRLCGYCGSRQHATSARERERGHPDALDTDSGRLASLRSTFGPRKSTSG
jgi:hypothetical protein